MFGCRAYALIGHDKLKSLQGHTIRGVFIGYPDHHAGWKVYDPVTKKTIISHDVIFNEAEFPGLSTKPQSSSLPAPSTNEFPVLPDEYDADSSNDPPPSVPIPLPAVDLPPPVGAVGALPPPPLDVEVPPLNQPPNPAPEPDGQPKHTHTPYQRDGIYYNAMQCQNAKASPLPPPANIDDSPSPWGVEVSDVDEEGEQEVSFNLNHASEDALMLAGHVFVEEGVDFQGFSGL